MSEGRGGGDSDEPIPYDPLAAEYALPEQIGDDPVAGGERRSHFIDLRPFRASPAFARLWIGSTLAGLGGQLTVVAVMLHVFELTQDTFAVAMIAVAGLVPMALAGIYGGMLADAFDRRTVALTAAVVTFSATALLAILAWTGNETVAWLYVLSIVISAANSVVMGTKAAIIPRLLPRELLPAAAALQGVAMGIMVMAGPALAGVLVAWLGYAATYSLDVVLMTSLFLGLWTLPKLVPGEDRVRPGLESLRDGWRFLRRAANIRTQYLMDIAAMTFGYQVALFPAIGAVLLGGGSVTTGFLAASVAAGAVVSSLFSGRIGQYRWHGIGIQRAIQWFAVATAAFGAVLFAGAIGWFAPPVVDETHANVVLIVAAGLALAGTGASDNVSAIYRNTMMQTAVPDEMRGRLQGLFIVVVTSGPRLGAFYAGAVATLGALWVAPVVGAVLIIVMVAVLVRANPGFRKYDALDPVP